MASLTINDILAGAAAGNAQAAHLAAVLAGNGLGMPQDWNRALDHLQRAAELGLPLARRQLVILSSDEGLVTAAAQTAPPPEIWKELRRSADIAAWLRIPQAQAQSAPARIFVAKDFVSPQMCDWLIERAGPLLQRATVHDTSNKGMGTVYSGARTNSDCEFPLPQLDLLIVLLRARIAAITQTHVLGMENCSVLRYEAGEDFANHFDYLNEQSHAEEIAQRGQRIITFLAYLSDGFEGGETDFPTIQWRYKGAKGDALFFWNVNQMGHPDWRTLHAGRPPASGVKWLLSQWIRGRV